MFKKLFFLFVFLNMLFTGCNGKQTNRRTETNNEEKEIVCGAERLNKYLHLLADKNVGIVANHTSMVENTHLLDTLLSRGVDVKMVFAPEHGFRGKRDAGETVSDGKDVKTGIPVRSLYGRSRKPKASDFKKLDIVIFDIQDVGVRFYTYISTMHYVMETSAETSTPLLILDRPNPNAAMTDGPVLDTAYSSFIGMHPVPVAHGMTVAEYARMIRGENWLTSLKKCDLSWVKCKNYNHDKTYNLPVPPSPNLPNQRSIKLYPSLCFLEGTSFSVGRGTDWQFQVIGHPDLKNIAPFGFIPEPNEGSANPKHEGKKCYGYDLREGNSYIDTASDKIAIGFLIKLYRELPEKDKFFNRPHFFDKLAGNSSLRAMIKQGKSEDEIRKSWQDDLKDFKINREKYLIYSGK